MNIEVPLYGMQMRLTYCGADAIMNMKRALRQAVSSSSNQAWQRKELTAVTWQSVGGFALRLS